MRHARPRRQDCRRWPVSLRVEPEVEGIALRADLEGLVSIAIVTGMYPETAGSRLQDCETGFQETAMASGYP